MDELKNQILDFVKDHWHHFGTYPLDVETDQGVLCWDQYWSFITEQEVKEGIKQWQNQTKIF